MEKLNLKKDCYLFVTFKTACDEETATYRTERSVEVKTHDDGKQYYHVLVHERDCIVEIWLLCERWHIVSIKNATY